MPVRTSRHGCRDETEVNGAGDGWTSPPWWRRPREGRPRAVARLISLVEGASPQLREVMAALAPLAGQRVRRRADRVAGRRQVHLHLGAGHAPTGGPGKRVGVLAVDPSSPFSGGALLGDRVRMSEHASDPGVYIRSMATRGHLGGLAWAAPQAIRVLDAAGCDVDPGGDGRRRPVRGGDRLAGRHLRRPARPRHGRRDPGGQGRNPGDRRRLRRQQGRPGRRGRDRPRAQPHAGPRRVPGRRRLAPAHRQDRRRPRRGHRRGRRGAGEAPGVDGGARRARTSGAAPAPPARSRRSPSPPCASASATSTATAASARWPSASWRASSTRTGRRTPWWRA